MANRAIGGARWKMNRNDPTAKAPPIEIRPVASAYGTILYTGTFVKMTTDGTMLACAAGDAIYGICDGAERYYDGSAIRRGGSLPVSTYGTNFERQSMIRVIPIRNQVFEMDADDGVSITTFANFQAAIGENCEWIAGTASGDQSGDLLDISTHANTNTLSLRIHDIATYPDQDYASSRVKILLIANLIQDTASGSTTGLA